MLNAAYRYILYENLPSTWIVRCLSTAQEIAAQISGLAASAGQGAAEAQIRLGT